MMIKNNAGLHAIQSDLPKGVHSIRPLPDGEFDSLWDSIIVDSGITTQLHSQAVLNFTIRGKVDRTVLPLHGVILLTGEPGTGKTSLARGLASRTAKTFPGARFRLLEVEPHSLTSHAMGKTQKAVSDLFSQAIAETALSGPTIVLLDEVETLAVDRSKLSLDANPIDIHRATDAVLVQLDALAEKFPQLLFVATSNFPQAVDTAFTSRCDLVARIPLPNASACELILKDCLTGLAKTYPPIGKLASAHQLKRVATDCIGLDGRTIRKVVANALAGRQETALDPSKVTIEDLSQAVRAAKEARSSKEKSQ